MSEFIQLMAAPFVACIVLTGIHAYLGLHVIEREVIFVDLALAQIAALGATVGLLWGVDLHSSASYFTALAATLVGAAVFAATRLRTPIVPQEAVIGIVYAVAASATIVVLSHAPDGSEELKVLLVGHLLFVGWDEIATIATVYMLVGLLHWYVREPLLHISRDPDAAFREGYSVRGWDFLFYATFGIVVTSSVELAGVLLVFSFLIVPSVCGVLLAETVRARLAVGWISGTLASVIGITASYLLDFPTGATVVCAFGVCLTACAGMRMMWAWRG